MNSSTLPHIAFPLAVAMAASSCTSPTPPVVEELDSLPGLSEPIEISLGEIDWRLPETGVTRNGDLIVAEVPPGHSGDTAWATADLDLSKYIGSGVQFTIHAKGRGLGTPRASYLGLKFMVCVTYSDGIKKWPDVPHRMGSWEDDLTFCCDLGGDVKSTTLHIGLQECTGRVTFDLSTLRAKVLGSISPRVNQNYIVRYPDKRPEGGGSLYRGVMLPGALEKIKEDDFATLEKWGANIVRYQMPKLWNVPGGWEKNEDFDAYMDFALGILATNVLPWAEKHGQKVVIDMHATPGARNARKENRMFYEERYATHFAEVWRRIAERFKGHPAIYGYDLVNEPLQTSPAPYSLLHVQLAAARAIREVDPDTPIIVAANGYGSPDGFETLSPLAMDNIIYQPHCYAPGAFTHQGVGSKKREGFVPYPNPEKGWDKEYIRKQLAPVREFELKHHARIFVGEFSAITWAPGADAYIRDCIDIFEEYGWDWCYHAFREWDGWSVEKTWNGIKDGRDVFVPSDDNPRKRALLEGFRRGKPDAVQKP